MTISRKIIATPIRTAPEVWKVITNLLTSQTDNSARKELLATAGIASSLIADETIKSTPIIIYGSGPRVHLYCLYDEGAVSGEDAKEDDLPFKATEGDWHMSLPCQVEDLNWVQVALKKISSRITAREIGTSIEVGEKEETTNNKSTEVNKEAFFRS